MPKISAVHDGERASDSPIMSSAPKVCRKCSAEILADAPEGLCTACLFETGLNLFADASAAGVGLSTVASAKVDGSDSDDVSVAGRKDKSGKTFAYFGDYELLEVIGRGGQGVVYRAHQKSLNRTVALKVIGLGHWATDAHLKRFRREAEAAASLDHPGIVPIYEVGEQEGSCYFSMKLIEGGQLDAALKREPMPIRKALELIAKVARTVHYAHEHGILHRDIKPGNILLDQKGEPHLTDFGLARLVETESTVTRTLEVLGTPSYMAPEQAVGNNAALTAATDLYGLGAVLYQLLTGQPPFAGGTTYETIKLLLDTEPRQPRALNRKIDRDLSTICLKCLEKDPKRRYSSAVELARDLERWLKHEPIRARRAGVFIRSRKWVRRNPTSTLLAASLVALAASSGWIVWKTEFIPKVRITDGVAVLPFENLSADPDNAYLANGVQEEILTRLASIAGLKVISRTSTQQYQSKSRNLREIANQLGVANIVEGSVQKAAGQVRVNVQLVNGQSDSHLWAQTYDRKLNDIFGVESEIAKRIAESLQAKLTGHEEQALAAKPTNNAEAYEAYLHGLAFVRGLGWDPIDAWMQAAGFFERAVQLDPNFAIAWARLSCVDAVIFFNRDNATTAARGDAAKRALEQAQKLAPDSSETLLALGNYQYLVLRDYGAAKTTFERVCEMLPGNSEVRAALGSVMRREGNWDQSIAYFERALALDPRNVTLLVDVALTYGARRQFPAALKLYDQVLAITPNDPDTMATKASVYQAEGNLREAARLLSGINEQTPHEVVFQIKITQLRLERKYPDAVRLLQSRLAQFHYTSEADKGRTQTALANAQRLAGDMAAAKTSAEQAGNTLEQLKDQQNDFSLAFHTEDLSQIYSLIGQKELAIKAAERAVILVPRAKDGVLAGDPLAGPGFEENLAVVQTSFRENSRAISLLTQLLQTVYIGGFYYPVPITPALLRFDPIWDPLRGDSAFQKLCEEKQP
jgi:serine/threonine protein kinase/Flp pilus assembly protein TadD